MVIWSGLRQRGRLVPSARRGGGPVRRHVWVLSGGGARGAAQVGAMSALVGAGVQPVALVGCSVGALNAAFMSSGTTPDRTAQLEENWRRLSRTDVFGGSRLSTVCNVVARRAALFSPDPLARLVDAWLPAPTFEELTVPLRVVTTSLTSGRPVYHETGPLRGVLLATAALPGLFPPVTLPAGDGSDRTELHVDGGVTDLVPVGAALDAAPTDLWVLDAGAAPGTGERRPRSALDVVLMSLTTSMRSRPMPALPGITVHHLVLRGGPAGRGGLMDFGRGDELIEFGRTVAQEALAAAAVPALTPVPRVRAEAARPSLVGAPLVSS